MNGRGQYSIIAALLVAAVLIGVVVTTYSLIRDFLKQEQTQTLNAVEETNSAIKQLLWLAAGIYSQVLQVTGSRDYAYRISYDYILNQTSYYSRMHPNWAISLELKKLDFEVCWFTSKSYSKGEISVRYDIAGLGIYNITYSTSCSLGVTLLGVEDKANHWAVRLKVLIDDGGEPFTMLGRGNFGYYCYWQANTTWTRKPPDDVTFENNSYILYIPKEINPEAYLIQVTDHRQLTVVASSYSKYNLEIAWESVIATGYKSISGSSNVDSSPDKGSHSNLKSLTLKDGSYDVLMESVSFLAKKGTFNAPNTAISGLGFRPKALIFWWTAQVNEGLTPNPSSNCSVIGFGFATNRDGTCQNYGVAMATKDRASASNTFRRRSNDHSIIFLSFSGNNPRLAAQAKVTSFTDDGFVLNWPTSDKNGYLIHYVALGGAEIVDAKAGSFTLTTATGTQDVAVGFKPDFLMFLWTFNEDTNRNENNAIIGLGFAASQVERCAMVVCSRDDQNPTDTYQQLRNDSCILILNPSNGNPYARVDFGQFLDNGFRVNKINAPASQITIFYLALKGGNYSVGSFNSPGPSMPIQDVAVGFQPKLVMFASQGRASSPNVASNATLAFGAAASAVGGTIERGAIWFGDPDSLNLTDNAMETSTYKVIQWRGRENNSFIIKGSADLKDFLFNGFRVSWSNFDSGKQIIYVAFGAKNHELDLEVQWTNVPHLNVTEAYLCIYADVSGATEPLNVDIWSNGTWVRAIAGITSGWNNVTVLQYLNSSSFTIRFKDTITIPDGVQDHWKIDAVLLRILPEVDLYRFFRSETMIVELLQNGTLRWLGQNLLSPFATPIPIPPLPVKAIRVNATINGVNRMIPFQIEEWASEFRVPLSLANNMSVFSDRNIIVFPINPNTTKVTIWWNGSDKAIQPSLAYPTDKYFSVNTVAKTLVSKIGGSNNKNLTIKIDSSGQKPFKVVSTAKSPSSSTSATAILMRINSQNASYGYSDPMYAITNGPVRAVLQHEVEWPWSSSSKINNTYAHIVLTLPANASYYTYQLRLMFLESAQDRVIREICLVRVNSSETFGYSSAVSQVRSVSADQMYGSAFKSPSYSVSANSISFYGRAESGSVNVKCLIVRHSDMKIIAVTNPVTVTTTAQWWTATFSSPVVLSPDTEYVLMVLPSGRVRLHYSVGSSGQGHYDTSNNYTSPTDPSDANHDNSQYCIYCTYHYPVITENGVASYPLVSGAGLFYNASNIWQHHWSQVSISSTRGYGIIFTDSANKLLYYFDKLRGGAATGAINVISTGTIEILPVAKTLVPSGFNFKNSLDIAWYGAVVTYDETTPIYRVEGNSVTGLWILADYPPRIEVSVER